MKTLKEDKKPTIEGYYAEESKINKKHNKIGRIIGYGALALALATGGYGIFNGIKTDEYLKNFKKNMEVYQQKYEETQFFLNSTNDLRYKNEQMSDIYERLNIENEDYKEREVNLEKKVARLNSELDSIEVLEEKNEKKLEDAQKYHSRTGYSLGGLLLTAFGFLGSYSLNERKRKKKLDNFEKTSFEEKK